MKKFTQQAWITVLALVLSVAALLPAEAQERHPWQVGVFGGASATLGNYHGDTARANLGYVGGVFADHYFGDGSFGLGLDARMLQHPLWGRDSLIFDNGYLATTYNNAKRFRHFGLAVGPTYQFTAGKFSLEAFVKGGVLYQQFPDYQRHLVYTVEDEQTPPGLRTDTLLVRASANAANHAWAWMGVGGLRFNYALSPNWSVFVQGDYLSTFGRQFGGKDSDFFIEEREEVLPITPGMFVKDGYDHYTDRTAARSTYTQTVNMTVGVKYTFGKRKPRTPLEHPVAPVVEKAPEPLHVQQQAKDVLVVVKDKQTGLALSGVKVVIDGSEGEWVSITNANGEAERLVGANSGEYRIGGEKNGIRTTAVVLTEADFAAGGTTIYKELLHDDPRFTLIGETVDGNSDRKLAGINTTLTNEGTDANMSQVSDGEGKFIYQLDQRADYNVVANQAGKYSQTERVTTMGLDRSKTLYVTLKLGVSDLEEGTSWVLKNILYDFDKSDIRPDAARVLDNVANIMQQNPTLRIELSSHTDSRGNDSYNLRLSQRRADAAVVYLVRKGIDRNRMVARGYGETRLLNDCGNGVDCPEELHQTNRRTEIQVLSY